MISSSVPSLEGVFLSVSCVSGATLGTGDSAVNKAEKNLMAVLFWAFNSYPFLVNNIWYLVRV